MLIPHIFQQKTTKFTKHDLRFLPHYQVLQKYKEMMDSSDVNQDEWEELVDKILQSKKGQVDRMTKYKNQNNEASTINKQ